MRMVTVRLSKQTLAIFEVIASDWKVVPHVAMEQCLMRDAATMSGWPGVIGVKCRLALAELADEEEEEIMARQAARALESERHGDADHDITPF